MSDLLNDADQAVLQRRRFLRGSALMAAAAGGAVAATAGSVLPATATPILDYAVTFGIPPERVFDTKTKTGQILDSSPSALTSQNRLRNGSWIDVAVVPSDSVTIIAVFVNLTSYSSLKAGSLVVSSQGDRPTGTTLSHPKGQTVSNSAIVGLLTELPPTGRGEDYAVVRIFASATTHVSLDLTGGSVLYSGDPVRTTPLAQAQQLAKAASRLRG